jgi:dTDP-4-dehydrorhamnose reductase
VKVVVTGAHGRVGSALVETLEKKGHKVIPLTRHELDLVDLPALAEALRSIDFDAWINPAAVSSPDQCERNADLSRLVNAEAPALMADVCAARGKYFLHFSTDYVFRGDLAHKLTENDIADPLNVYGRQKRMAELAVLSNHPRATVMRVSWVYGGKVPAFVEGCMERLRMGEDIDAIADKWSIPTAMPDLCEWVNFLLHEQPASLLHGCHSGPPVSWYGIALYLSELFGKASSSAISPKALADASHFVAPRPIHTAMDNQLLSTMLPSAIADWREVMSRAMNFR